MANQEGGRAPWLIAAWPGMGNVAVIAAGYLVRQLDMEEAGEMPSRDHFDVGEVEAKSGIIEPTRLPRGMFFRWKNTGRGHDLVVFLGEAQPASGTYAYAHELLERAQKMGVERVFTFASMAAGLHPSENPKVTGVATDPSALAELRRAEVEPLREGQIGGLNGVLIGVAAERGMTGVCLLAEIPFFAATVPNPKAARAALSVFSIMAGIDVSLEELSKHAAVIDKALIEAMEKMERQREEGGIEEQEGDEEDEEVESPPEEQAKAAAPGQEGKIDYATRSRIERMFAEAQQDRSKAMRLKEELDRLGVFRQYEDRFLDLFRRAE